MCINITQIYYFLQNFSYSFYFNEDHYKDKASFIDASDKNLTIDYVENLALTATTARLLFLISMMINFVKMFLFGNKGWELMYNLFGLIIDGMKTFMRLLRMYVLLLCIGMA